VARKDVLAPIYVNSTTTSPFEFPISQSLAANFNTISTNVLYKDSIAYQMNVTTSDSVGQFYLQESVDNVNFVDVGACGTVNAANTSIVVEVDISRTAPWIQLRYQVGTAGTGMCQILLTAKQVGG